VGIDKAALKKEVLDIIAEHGRVLSPSPSDIVPSDPRRRRSDLLPIYEHLCALLGWPVDPAKVSAMREKNEAKLKELEAKLEDAQTNAGEQEIRDVLLARAEYLALLGDRSGASKAFEETDAKTSGVGNKMDLVFSQIRSEVGVGARRCIALP